MSELSGPVHVTLFGFQQEKRRQWFTFSSRSALSPAGSGLGLVLDTNEGLWSTTKSMPLLSDCKTTLYNENTLRVFKEKVTDQLT